jgi:hypothetical protein
VLLQEDVCHVQSATGPEHVKYLCNHLRLVQAEVEDPIRDHHAHGRRRHRQSVGAAKPEIEVRQPSCLRIPLRLREHLLHDVYPDHCASWLHLSSSQPAIHAGPASKIKDTLARSEFSQRERIPHASK